MNQKEFEDAINKLTERIVASNIQDYKKAELILEAAKVDALYQIVDKLQEIKEALGALWEEIVHG